MFIAMQEQERQSKATTRSSRRRCSKTTNIDASDNGMMAQSAPWSLLARCFASFRNNGAPFLEDIACWRRRQQREFAAAARSIGGCKKLTEKPYR
jgi:hypothetical protein